MADKRKQLSSITKGMFSPDVVNGNVPSEEETGMKPESERTADNAEVIAEEVESPAVTEPVIKQPAARSKRPVSSPAKPKNSEKSKSIKHAEATDEETTAMKTERPSIYWTKDFHTKVKMAATLNDKSISAFVSMVVEEYLDKNQDELEEKLEVYRNAFFFKH